jgi:ABC-type nitrate/sulfonate/bicarbonate transport system permease component
MQSAPTSKAVRKGPSLLAIVGFVLIPAVWISLKQLGLVSDRYLPAPDAVVRACFEVEPSVFYHLAYTAFRLVAGFISGVLAGVLLGIAINKSAIVSRLVSPILNSMRSVPAIAIVPFFLLWFGFSEYGKILLVVTGIAFNIAIATSQVLSEIPEKHRILFNSFGIAPSSMMWDYTIPRIAETLLPTVRFSLSTAMGVVIASELLGSQIGLGYLMQTARSTFSMHVIFLATILLGLLNALVDFVVTRLWTRSVYWK